MCSNKQMYQCLLLWKWDHFAALDTHMSPPIPPHFSWKDTHVCSNHVIQKMEGNHILHDQVFVCLTLWYNSSGMEGEEVHSCSAFNTISKY